MMDLPISGNYVGKEKGKILSVISQEEHYRGHPILSAIAVSSRGSPCECFFGLVRSLEYKIEDTTNGKLKF